MQRDIWIGRQKEEEEEEGRNLVHSFPLICLSQNLKSNHNPLQKGWSAEWYQIDLLPSEERGNGRGTTHWTACEKRNTMHKVPLAYIIVFSQKKKENWTLQQEACKLFSNYPDIKLIVGHSLSQTYVGWGCRRGGETLWPVVTGQYYSYICHTTLLSQGQVSTAGSAFSLFGLFAKEKLVMVSLLVIFLVVVCGPFQYVGTSPSLAYFKWVKPSNNLWREKP